MAKRGYEELLALRLTNEQAASAQRHGVSVLLDNIRSLYNVGSVFRTADAMLVKEVILTGYTPVPPRKEITKTALGADVTVPWRYMQSPVDAVRSLQENGVRVYAVELTDDARRFDELRSDDFPCCLVLGNEISGVGEDVLALCNGSVEIPMYGVKHSFNVAVAAGIAIVAAVEAWRKLG
ncbi:MAG: TrmH family RNA methyltransferase [Candidatus Kapabacteria bacterium]|nr:TrmH family RNA methyltransferase [Candidatus Kapabacteria bacterium]